MTEFARPPGTVDVLPEQASVWQWVEAKAREVFDLYHYREMRTPIFEHTAVFERGVGDTTDIVQKEMYTFTDRGGRSLTLRPEGTAGVVRAFVEGKLHGGTLPGKYFYLGPMFRYEKKQAGRYRQFNQYGVEVIGSDDPRADAEVIELANRFLQVLGVEHYRLELNSVGCPQCRAVHKALLLEHLLPIKAELCQDCQGRFDKNPMRILDCKIDGKHPLVLSAPKITDHLCVDCAAHFEEVKGHLDALHVQYELTPTMVRGLDYYTRTAFEFIGTELGAQSTIIGGGRYNGLVSMLGGPDLQGVGFAGGLERLLLTFDQAIMAELAVDKLDVFVITMGEAAAMLSVFVLQLLRSHGFRADGDYAGRGFKAQLKLADRYLAPAALIIGDDEVAQHAVMLRDMTSKEQQLVAIDELISALRKYK